MEIFEQVVLCIQKAKGINKEINASDRLREDLDIDSFDSLMVVCELEDVFKISVNPESIKVMATVQDIVDGLEATLTASPTH